MKTTGVTTALWGRVLDPRAGGVARRGGRLGQKETAVSGKNRIMIYGPKNDGTYVVEFRAAAGEALAISIPRTEASSGPILPGKYARGLSAPDVP